MYLITLDVSSVILFYTSNACMLLVLFTPWGNGNKPPAYVLSILNSENIIYLCNSCKPNFTTNIPTPISQLTSNTLSDITAKLDEITNIVGNTYTITDH